MEAHQRTRFTDHGLALHRDPSGAPKHLDLMSGAMHYWRIDSASWRPCLAAMKDLGLGIVETYVPWSVHEVRPGRLSFDGRRDLAAFLGTVSDLGMHAILRPGPMINAELTYYGFPERILRERGLLAVSGRNTPVWLPAPPRMFPVPSYAAAGFIAEVSGYLAEIARVAGPFAWPNGPVVAIQLDNESQMFFRLGAYDHDYHPDALAWWAEYSGGAKAPTAWHPDEAERCVLWVRFREEYIARALSWQREVIAQSELGGLACFHNLPGSHASLVNLPRVERAAGAVGMDVHLGAADYVRCRRQGLYLAGSARALPYVPELGVGGAPFYPPHAADSQRAVILGTLAAGARGINFYMTVGRERWYGAPISERGERAQDAAWLHELVHTLTEVSWTTLRREAPFALIASRADARFALASSLVDPLSPLLTEMAGLGGVGAAAFGRDEDAVQYRRCVSAMERALDMAQIPYVIVDEDCLAEALMEYRAVIAPTVRRIDSGLWRALHEIAARGVTVVLGPGRPSLDELGRPLDPPAPPPRAGFIRPQSLADIDGLADDLVGLAGDLDDVWLAADGEVDCSLYRDPDGVPRVLFVGNRTAQAVTAGIVVPDGCKLRDPLGNEHFSLRREGDDTLAEVALAGYGVRMFLIEALSGGR